MVYRDKILLEFETVLYPYFINVRGRIPREGIFMECPLYGLFHGLVIIIITSRMVVSKIFLTVAAKGRVINGLEKIDEKSNCHL